MNDKIIKAYVSGRVQGVWFRDSTRNKAIALQITGYAKNLPDGRVEVLASGSDEHINTLIKWLHQGPPNAQVESVVFEEVETSTSTGFVIL